MLESHSVVAPLPKHQYPPCLAQDVGCTQMNGKLGGTSWGRARSGEGSEGVWGQPSRAQMLSKVERMGRALPWEETAQMEAQTQESTWPVKR